MTRCFFVGDRGCDRNHPRVYGIQAFALAIVAFACLALFGGLASSKAEAATPVILNTSSTGGQTNWLENFTIADTTNNAANRIWMTFSVKHDPGRSIAGVRIDDDYNGTDDSATATLRTGTNQTMNVVNGFNHSRVTLNYQASIGNNGLDCPFIGSGTATSSRPLRARVQLDNGEQTAVTASNLRFVRSDCNARDDMPFLYQRSQTASSVVPGTDVSFTITGDDTDSVATTNQAFGGINWRARRLSDGATTSSSLICWGDSDNTARTFTANFPNRGRWVVEAQLRNSNNSCGTNPNADAYFYIGTVDVNTAAATSPTLGLDATRPNIGGNTTVTATFADGSDSAQGGRVQVLEWDLDQNSTNGVGGFEAVELGEIAGLTSPRNRVINTAGMTPGLKTVRARVTDNGAMTAADSSRRQRIVTTQFLVDTPPVALPDELRTVTGDALPFVLAATDVDDDTLTYSILDAPDNGTLTGSGANRTYTPDAGFAGVDTFTFQADDGFGGTSQADVSVRVDPDVADFSGPNGTRDSRAGQIEFDSSVNGATFECQIDSEAWIPCTSPWSLTDLDEGSHTMRTRVTANSLTNADATEATWIVDAFPKIQVEDAPSAETNETGAAVDFALSQDGATVTPTSECRLDGHAWTPCTSPVAYEDLDDGEHTISIRATDAKGKQSVEEVNWEITTAGTQTSIDGPLPSAITRDNTASITFTASGNVASFECSLDGEAWAACASPVELTDLADGTHTLRIRAIDGLGNIEELPAQVSWTVDRTNPIVKIESGPDGAISAGGGSFEFTSNESFSTFECKLDDGEFAACVSPFNLPTELSDGAHYFRVAAIDRAGNRSLAARRDFRVLSVAPEAVLTGGPAQGQLTNSNAASFSFSTNATGAEFECRVDQADWKPCESPTALTGLSDGPHTFEVRAIDEVGNRSPEATIRSWTVDTAAPEVTITEGPAAVSNDTSPAFHFVSSEENSTFECSLDGATFASCTSPKTLSGLADGQHQFRVRATDQAGNRGLNSASSTWRVNTEVPPPPDPEEPPTPPAPCDFKVKQDRCDEPWFVATARAPLGKKAGKGMMKLQLDSGGPTLHRALVRFAPGLEAVVKRGKGGNKIGRVVFTGSTRKVQQLTLPKATKRSLVVAGRGSTSGPKMTLKRSRVVIARVPAGTTGIVIHLRSGKRLGFKTPDCGPRRWASVLTDTGSNRTDVNTRDDVTCTRKGNR